MLIMRFFQYFSTSFPFLKHIPTLIPSRASVLHRESSAIAGVPHVICFLVTRRRVCAPMFLKGDL